MSLYQTLIRRAWKSGVYRAPAPESRPGAEGAGDADSLRTLLRSKMEWIVEREAFDATNASPSSREEGMMKLAQYVKFREEKFGGVLFETRSEKVFTLSPTGAAVVKEIVAGGGAREIMGRLKERFEDQSGALEKEAGDFIADLKAKGLITE